MEPIPYELSPLDLVAPDDSGRHEGFVQAIFRAFHDARPGSETARRYVEMAARDRMRATGVWLPEGSFGAGPVPVATYMSFDGTLNTGAGLVPVWMITDVTVSPAHRRRGLLTRLMNADLGAAVAGGFPLAALTASEASIYGRFGFGPATFRDKVRVGLGPTFALRREITGVRVEIVAPEVLGTIPEDDFTVVHEHTRGSISRPSFYGPWVRGDLDPETGEPDKRVHCAVALDGDDRPVGHVSWKHIGRKDGRSTIELVDLVGRTTDAHLALWQFVAGIDLVEAAEVSMPGNDPLRWALRDLRTIHVVGREDLLWLRVLDVPAALMARPWRGTGTVALEVADPLGHAAGRWTVTVRDGVPSVEADGRDGVHLDAESLASLYLGAVDVDTLVAAGRIGGDAEGIATLGTLLADTVPPATRTFF